MRHLVAAVGGGLVGWACGPMESPLYWVGVVGAAIVLVSQHL